MKKVVAIIIPLIIGALSSRATGDIRLIYENLNLPSFAPKGIIFPIVWSILYILMGVSSYLIWKKDQNLRSYPLEIYYISLILNFFWSIIFFRFELYSSALIWLITLLVVVIYMTKLFYKEEKLAGILQIPYILWLIFAGILNLYVILLN